MGIDGIEGAEVAVEELTDHFAEPGVVLGKARRVDGDTAGVQCVGEKIELGSLAAAVDAFDGDEPAERLVVCTCDQSSLNSARSEPR